MTTKRFEGRRAVVTGASRGIGAAIAHRLAAEGADVVVAARTVDAHDHLAGSLNETLAICRSFGGRAEAIAVDLADPASRAGLIGRAAEALGGPIEILVNNAAAAIYQSMLDYPRKRRDITFEVNVQAPIDLMQEAIPAMVAAGEGWIVNVSSATARPAEGPPFGTGGVRAVIGMYGASKAALNRLTNAFAVELFEHRVRANTVEPRSAVASEGANALLANAGVDRSLYESMEAMVEGVVALCGCEPERTGRSFVSLDLIDELGLEVRSLDNGPFTPTDTPV
jgi:citronellol/citronellal dehydrogenase